MLQKVHVGVGVLNQIPLDWEGNFQRICAHIEEAKLAGVEILCLPEMCLTGYGCEDQFYAPFTHTKGLEYVAKLLPFTENILVFVGLPLAFAGNIYNVVACLSHTQLVAYIPKQFLAVDGVHYESRWFTPWPAGQRTFLHGIPLGDYRIAYKDCTIGVEICQDAWEGDSRPAYALAARGVSLICNPTASHFSFGKSTIRKQLCLDGSLIIEGAYLFANLLGNESGRVIFDGDAYIAQEGKLVAETKRFSFQDGQSVYTTLDLKTYVIDADDVIIAPVGQPVAAIEKLGQASTWESSKAIKEEEFAHAIALGLWDYVRKSYSNGFVISLSGGADSSAIAALCYVAVCLAEEELGFAGIKDRLSYIPWMQSVTNRAEFLAKFIHTLYQGTVNSSVDTRASAAFLASDIGADHHEIDIDSIVAGYRSLVEGAIGRPLTWAKDDITLQNVQARVRAPSAWMLANITNSLLLATSNRSEASVGYATMDGDTSGSISPIAGIDKMYLRSWLLWMEKQGIDGKLRVAGLAHVNRLEPSAELRPLETKQVDEEDLMPYSILNAIERWAFYERLSPAETQAKLIEQFSSHFTHDQLHGFIQRFYTLWARNQWKRERYAPGFHVDDYSLDPKSWLRFPILSAGLAKDLPQ